MAHLSVFDAVKRRVSIARADALLARYADSPALLDALHALAILDEGGECAPADPGMAPLTNLVVAYLRRNRPALRVHRPATLGELFDRRAARYAREQLRSLKSLASARRYFCSRLGEDTPAEDLDEARIEAALEDRRNCETWNDLFRRLRLTLNWGVRERLIEESPLRRLGPRPVAWREPAFFAPDKVERVMRLAEAHPGTLDGAVGARLALGFFAGMRTAEILRARWEDFDADGGTLRIPQPKGWTRGARPRLVELEPCAVAWLRLWRDWAARGAGKTKAEGEVVRNARRLKEWKDAYLAPLGLSWGNDAAHNAMRHTYATMHVGAFRDAAATALNLGHGRSTEMLEKHYRGLVPKAVADKHWAIFPGGGPLPPPVPEPGQGRRTDLALKPRLKPWPTGEGSALPEPLPMRSHCRTTPHTGVGGAARPRRTHG